MQALAQHLSDELAPTLLEYRAKHGLREQLGSVKMGEGGAELSQATYLKDIFGSFDRPDIERNWSGEPFEYTCFAISMANLDARYKACALILLSDLDNRVTMRSSLDDMEATLGELQASLAGPAHRRRR